MVNGCNSLISQQFGTHSQHEFSLAQLRKDGVGDADFVVLTDATIGAPILNSPRVGWLDANYVYRPLLSAEAMAAWEAGDTVTTYVVGWYNVDTTSCQDPAWCQPKVSEQVYGLVAEPPLHKYPLEEWGTQRIAPAPAAETVYVKLGDTPAPWYQNLAIFLGGLLIAIVPEARRFQRGKDAAST